MTTWSIARWTLRPLILLILLLGCRPAPGASEKNGRLLVWHNWEPPASGVLLEILEGYTELYPDVDLIIEYMPADNYTDLLTHNIEDGLGPDVIVGLATPDLHQFIDHNQIVDLTKAEAFQRDHFNQKFYTSVHTGQALYAAPFAGHTNVLYYNISDVSDPVASFKEILNSALRGHRIGVPSTFFDAYWGIDAFNGSVFTNEGAVDPSTGAKEWFTWMLDAQARPSIIFESDIEELVELFIEGELDYYIGSSAELPQILAELDASQFGVAPLPSHNNPFPGAFLEVETVTINQFSSNIPLAVDLINFMTNASSQRKIAHGEIGRIPVNANVQLDPRVGEVEATLRIQQQRAIIIPFELGHYQNELFAKGDQLYLELLQGVLDPAEMSTSLREHYTGAQK